MTPRVTRQQKYIIGKEIFCRLRIWMLFFPESGYVLCNYGLKGLFMSNKLYVYDNAPYPLILFSK